MIGKGATPSFFAIANDNYTLTNSPTFTDKFSITGDKYCNNLLQYLSYLSWP